VTIYRRKIARRCTEQKQMKLAARHQFTAVVIYHRQRQVHVTSVQVLELRNVFTPHLYLLKINSY